MDDLFDYLENERHELAKQTFLKQLVFNYRVERLLVLLKLGVLASCDLIEFVFLVSLVLSLVLFLLELFCFFL